jgi:DnaJ-class molecular chaperone
MTVWTRIKCSFCNGHGVYQDLGGGPADCKDCGGSGYMWLSENNRIADYPGGPFRGSIAKE